MSSGLTREQREDRVRAITTVFQESALFQPPPEPREDIKPRLAENLITLIDGRAFLPGEFISSGLIRSALEEVDWDVSDSTISTVLWHLSQINYIQIDALYYIIPEEPGSPTRLDIGKALKEASGRDRSWVVYNFISAAECSALNAIVKDENYCEAIRHLFGLKSLSDEVYFLRRLRIRVYEDPAGALRRSMFSWESLYWTTADRGPELKELFKDRMNKDQERQAENPIEFNLKNRSKWMKDSLKFRDEFRNEFRNSYMDDPKKKIQLLFTSSHSVRTLVGNHNVLAGKKQKVYQDLQDKYKIEPIDDHLPAEDGDQGSQYFIGSVTSARKPGSANRENILLSFIFMPTISELEIRTHPLGLKIHPHTEVQDIFSGVGSL